MQREYLKAARLQTGLTALDVGLMIGGGKKTYKLIEQGNYHKSLTVSQLVDIAGALGVDPRWALQKEVEYYESTNG